MLSFLCMSLPTSPHLQIYRLPFSAILSISHRISGFFLFFYLSFFFWHCFFDLYLPFLNFFQIFYTGFQGKVFFGLVTFCFAYHLTNGVRHFFWDCSIFMSKKAIFYSNCVVLIFSGLLGCIIYLLLYILFYIYYFSIV